ncbi:hypothetical protein Q3G72_010930 [Acer saccharum]|nr:hypothetical protein Q3G72_010930 [Acer saccharum]
MHAQATMSNSLVLIFLALFALSSASTDAFESIDCGGSGYYTDENFIVWTGDDEFMQNIGDTKVVQSGNAVSDHVMSTLRVFSSTRKKNCYSIDVDKGVQVLVRASFYYGNYDKKSAPPSFDLHFNGNYWDTVETSSENVVYYEAIFVVKDNGVSVCVAQTKPNQFPFMSALEVRSLDSHMYNDVDAEYALFLKTRTTYGAKDIVRFTSDPYDRIWVPGAVGDRLTTVTSTAIVIDVSVPDNPPQAALQNAITTSSTSQHMVLGNGLFPAKPVPIYVNMYFSEVSELDPSTQTRSFQVFVNDVPASQQAIVPPYGSVTELYIGNITSSSNTSFTLAADSNSTLPPLINAMEVFYVSNPMTDGTNSKDVEGLASLQSQFDVLKEWGGDPCLPSPYTWDWVNCSTDAIPRVTALYLSGFNLSGPLPDFSSMDALEIIDLHGNSLSESVPDFLGSLPSLKQLNLADNEFSGPIPTSLSNNKKLKLVVSGNPNLCVSGKSCDTTTGSSTDMPSGSGKKKSSKLPAILGGTIPSFIVFWAIVGIVAVLHHRRKTAAISAIHTGQGGGGGNRPNGTANANMMGKIGHAVINGIKVNIEEQINSETSNQMDDQTAQNGQQDGRNT